MKLPEIRFKYGSHLDPYFQKFYEEILDEKNLTPLDRSRGIEKSKEYLIEWKKNGRVVLRAMCEILELEFYQNTIDVYIVSKNVGGFSDPLIISGYYENTERAVDVLTHELLHRLLTDNTEKLDVGEIWKNMFPDVKDVKALNHIVLHAVHKKIYLEVLRSEDRYKRDLFISEQDRRYQEAWNIVNQTGYEQVINDFKSRY